MNWLETGVTVEQVPASAYPALRELVAAFASHRPRWGAEGDVLGRGNTEDGGNPIEGELAEVSPESVTIRSADVVRPGRPGLISVIADVPGRLVHAVLGLRAPGDEVQFLADSDDSPLGIFEDGDGLAVVFDATADAELMRCLLDAVGGGGGSDYERVRRIAITDDTVSVTFDDRVAFTIYQQLPPGGGPHPGTRGLSRPRRGRVQPPPRPHRGVAPGRDRPGHRAGVSDRQHRRVVAGPYLVAGPVCGGRRARTGRGRLRRRGPAPRHDDSQDAPRTRPGVRAPDGRHRRLGHGGRRRGPAGRPRAVGH